MIVRRSVETPKFSFILKYTTIQNVSVITYAPKGGVSINRNIPNWYALIYSQLLGGSASFPGNAATKSTFSRARSVYWSVYCSVRVSQRRRFHPAFSTSPGLCCQWSPCWTEHWTELESENIPPRKRKRLSLQRLSEPDLLNGQWRMGGRCTKRLAFSALLRETLSLQRRLTSLSVSVLRHCQALKMPD